jgi:hypothetical protein
MLVVVLAVMALCLSGCAKPSLVGKWFDPKTGYTMTIDKDWINYLNVSEAHYAVTGESSIQVTRDGNTTDVRYLLEGDSLNVSTFPYKGEFLRVGSPAYGKAKEVFDQEQGKQQTAENVEFNTDLCLGNRDAILKAMEPAFMQKYGEVGLAKGYIANPNENWLLVLTGMAKDGQLKTLDYATVLQMATPAFGPDSYEFIGNQQSIKVAMHGNDALRQVFEQVVANHKCPSGGVYSVDLEGYIKGGSLLACSVHGAK